jgi:hypothetical protein
LEILDTNKGRRVDIENTICEEHRKIADLLICRLKDKPDLLKEIMPHLNEAFKMGIKLVLALIEKKINLPEFEVNNVFQTMKLRKERDRLVKEINEAGCRL